MPRPPTDGQRRSALTAAPDPPPGEPSEGPLEETAGAGRSSDSTTVGPPEPAETAPAEDGRDPAWRESWGTLSRNAERAGANLASLVLALLDDGSLQSSMPG